MTLKTAQIQHNSSHTANDAWDVGIYDFLFFLFLNSAGYTVTFHHHASSIPDEISDTDLILSDKLQLKGTRGASVV